MNERPAQGDWPQNAPAFHLAVLAIAKNECPYLLEWIAYHRVVGVEHFFVYDDDSDDGTTAILAALHQGRIVTHIRWPSQPDRSRQLTAYADGFARFGERTEWMAVIDLDEFLVPLRAEGVPQVLAGFADCGGLAAHWKIFGSAGEDEQRPGLVMDRFRRCAAAEFDAHRHVKSIVKAALVDRPGIHICYLREGRIVDERRRPVDSASSGIHDGISHEYLQVNHYCTKSREEWQRKWRRGRAGPSDRSGDRYRPDAFFERRDRNESADGSILRFRDATLAEMDRLCRKLEARAECNPALADALDTHRRWNDARPHAASSSLDEDEERAATAADDPLVSVIVPAYNHETFVEGCLRSILEQSYGNLEVILVDDGSRDGTYAVAERVLAETSRPHRLLRQENAGAHAAINRGLEEARGEYLAILNSDDVYYRDCISRLVHAARSSGAAFLFTLVEHVDALGRPADADRPAVASYRRAVGELPLLPNLSFALLRSNIAITSGNFFFHRRLWQRIGHFADLRFCHDWDFLLRAAIETEPMLIEEPLLGYRLHDGNNFSRNAALARIETQLCLLSYCRRVMAAPPNNHLAPTPASWGPYFDPAAPLAGLESLRRAPALEAQPPPLNAAPPRLPLRAKVVHYLLDGQQPLPHARRALYRMGRACWRLSSTVRKRTV